MKPRQFLLFIARWCDHLALVNFQKGGEYKAALWFHNCDEQELSEASLSWRTILHAYINGRIDEAQAMLELLTLQKEGK